MLHIVNFGVQLCASLPLFWRRRTPQCWSHPELDLYMVLYMWSDLPAPGGVGAYPFQSSTQETTDAPILPQK